MKTSSSPINKVRRPRKALRTFRTALPLLPLLLAGLFVFLSMYLCQIALLHCHISTEATLSSLLIVASCYSLYIVMRVVAHIREQSSHIARKIQLVIYAFLLVPHLICLWNTPSEEMIIETGIATLIVWAIEVIIDSTLDLYDVLNQNKPARRR